MHGTGVKVLQPVLYCLRHGGASADILEGRRSLAEVAKRGRWLSDSVVRRYEKATRALQQVNKLDARTLKYAKEVEAKLQYYFHNLLRTPSPP